ncbi:helix-turn-helix domain-containing protein [Maribacter sp.]|nr:helix-turn-helix domain-containing protein [Maribacter sp.]
MNFPAIMNFLLIAGAFQGFVFNVVTFLARKKVEKPVVLLNLLVFFLSLNNLQTWLITKGFVFDIFFLKHFVFPWYVLILPMFYAFLISYVNLEKKRIPFLRLSVAIFILELLARSIVLTLVDQGRLELEAITTYNALEDAVTLLYSIFIFSKALRLIFKYPELYPDILTFDDLNWIKKFMKWGGVIFVLWAIAVVLNIFSDSIKAPYSYYPLRIASSVLIYWIGYQAFFRYVLLKDRVILRRQMGITDLAKTDTNVTEYDTSKKIEKQEAEFNEIHAYIVGQKKYYDPAISLEKLSGELDMSMGKLSMLVNQISQKNFSDYINSLRINDAKELLANPEFGNYTIVAIGLECGFNSKSTFYSAFKKFTGQTPTVYRKQYALHS